MRGTIALSVSLLFSPALAQAQRAADSPASLSAAQSFEAPLLSEVSHAEIADARRAMASAVSAEKFIDGVKTVLFVALAAYGAYNAWWADGGSGSTTMLAPQQAPMPAAGGGM